jgi:hypothetical protein
MSGDLWSDDVYDCQDEDGIIVAIEFIYKAIEFIIRAIIIILMIGLLLTPLILMYLSTSEIACLFSHGLYCGQ